MLDSTFYPHIFDTIVKVAPPESLLVLRAYSQVMRERADRLLFEHVVVTFPPSAINSRCSFKAVLTPFGSNLHFEWLYDQAERGYFPTPNPLRHDNHLSGKGDDVRKSLRTYVDRQVRNATVVDISHKANTELSSRIKAELDAEPDLGWATFRHFRSTGFAGRTGLSSMEVYVSQANVPHSPKEFGPSSSIIFADLVLPLGQFC